MKKILMTLTALIALNSWADCPQFYPKGIAVPANTVELCSSFFVNRFDKNNKATIMSVELLDKSNGAPGTERINVFYSDPRVGKSSPTNADYSKSGFDRGHMAPAGDASDSSQMRDTFALTNMTPQEPTLNRNSWKQLEEHIRKDFVNGTTNLKIVTLAIYTKPVKRIGANIPVPSGYWKVVYKNDVATKFYYASNKYKALVTEYTSIYVDQLIKNSTNF